MKSNAKRKTSINNVIAYGTVVAAYTIIQVLVGTGYILSLMKGLLVLFYIYIIVVVFLGLTVGILGELSLEYTDFMRMGAFASALFSKYMRGTISPALEMVTAILIGAIIAALFSVVIGIPVLRLRGDYLAIVTLASGEIIKNPVNVVYLGRDAPDLRISFKDSMSLKLGEGGETLIRGAQGITGTPRAATPTIGIILVLITLLIVMNPVNSRTGRVIMAIWDNRIATKSIGINITKYKLLVFSTSVGLIGIIGVLYAHNLATLTVLFKNFECSMSIVILVYVVLGDAGNIRGSAIMTVTLHLLPEMLRGLGNYHVFMYAIMLILTTLFSPAPQFVAMRKRLVEKFNRKDKKPAKEAA